MDLLAAAVASTGLALAGHGYAIAGAVLYVGSLVGLAIAMSRPARPRLVLPFSFGSHFVVLAVAMLAAVLMRNVARGAQAGCLGLMAYHYACVSLVERKVRYVPWAAPFGRWRTATLPERPFVYWSFVVLFLCLATVLLGAVCLATAGCDASTTV